MMDRPILFNGAMARAILEGRKTQTRQVIKPQPEMSGQPYLESDGIWCDNYERSNKIGKCPYGRPGDRLWVRETWRVRSWDDLMVVTAIEYKDGHQYYPDDSPVGPAGDRIDEQMNDWADRAISDLIDAGYEAEDDKPFELPPGVWPVKWRPSIHMPRWASRITLKIVGVRVEKVQEITEKDIIAEGVTSTYPHSSFEEPLPNPERTRPMLRLSNMKALWDSINAKRGFGWSVNPWVWVIKFKVVPDGEQPEKKQRIMREAHCGAAGYGGFDLLFMGVLMKNGGPSFPNRITREREAITINCTCDSTTGKCVLHKSALIF